MNKYEQELENLKNNIHYGNCISLKDLEDEKKCSTVAITRKLFQQTHFLIFFK